MRESCTAAKQAWIAVLALFICNPVFGAVHNWSFVGPGGRYGITEAYWGIRPESSETHIWFGPLGRERVPVTAPVAAFGLMAGSVTFLLLGFYGISRFSDGKGTA